MTIDRNNGENNMTYGHPLVELYCKAKETYEKASLKLEEVKSELGKVEAELAGIELELAKRYGPGYLTVKTVRNRQGKRYRYLVWRTMERRDIYLDKEYAVRILQLRERQAELKKLYAKYSRLVKTAKLYMESTKSYAETCGSNG